MKTWQRYSEFLVKGEWHVHTFYTDGQNSIDEYCQKAVEVGIPLIAFTEHVRKNLNYDFQSFLSDIELAKEKYDLIILSGCEAKVLQDGELDIPSDILRDIDYPIFAFHSFPLNVDLYIDCVKRALKNKFVNTWAHPGLFLKKYSLELNNTELKEIFSLMSKEKVLLEINVRHNLPAKKWLFLANQFNVCSVRGSDVHTIKDLCKFEQF